MLPGVPTIAETGVRGYEAVIWLGIIAPRNTPPAVIGRLNAEITRITANPEVRQEWAERGALPMTMSPEEFSRFLADAIANWERIVKLSGARPISERIRGVSPRHRLREQPRSDPACLSCECCAPVRRKGW